ncbi:MAG: hypothetical protein PVF85_01240 [Anaerolineales bacterium]
MPSLTSGKLEPLTAGGGRFVPTKHGELKLEVGQQPDGYTLAQLDDYHRLPRSKFRWEQPLHLSLTAHASTHEPQGTLGFGFWNDPFTVSIGQAGTARRFPASPQALWFFYGSPPNDIALAPAVPGHGWKASVLRAPPIPSLFLAPAALAAIGLAQIALLRRPVMETAIGVVDAAETLIDVRLDEVHRYELIWKSEEVSFYVDGQLILESPITPIGPLGFVAWIDNQYAVASPEGGFRFGWIPTPQRQALVLSDLSINGTPLITGQESEA